MFKLVKIKPTGIRIAVTEDNDDSYLIETAKILMKKSPAEQYGVTDNLGYFVWPEKLTQAYIESKQYNQIM
jgi:hypothetical protein